MYDELLHYLLHEAEHLVGHVAEGKVDPCTCGHHGAAMREHAEALFAMVAAHARVAHTAKGDVLVGDVHNGVVDAGTTR